MCNGCGERPVHDLVGRCPDRDQLGNASGMRHDRRLEFGDVQDKVGLKVGLSGPIW